MAEFSKAMEVEPGAYCEQIAGALRAAARVQWKRGNKFFLAKQHAYFLLAYGECKCVEHSCTGCALTLKVATMIEHDINSLDRTRCDIEEERANAYWVKEWRQSRDRLERITDVSHEQRRQREGGQSSRLRERSLAIEAKAERGS